MSKISPRENLFVAKFVQLGGNGSRAAREAGFTLASCRVRASEMLKRPEIRAAISELAVENLAL